VALKAVGAAAAGAGVGGLVYGTVGAVGQAVTGSAVGVALGPFVIVGAGLGAAGYGLYRRGRQSERSRDANSTDPPPD
jgi:hypothetical protein